MRIKRNDRGFDHFCRRVTLPSSQFFFIVNSHKIRLHTSHLVVHQCQVPRLICWFYLRQFVRCLPFCIYVCSHFFLLLQVRNSAVSRATPNNERIVSFRWPLVSLPNVPWSPPVYSLRQSILKFAVVVICLRKVIHVDALLVNSRNSNGALGTWMNDTIISESLVIALELFRWSDKTNLEKGDRRPESLRLCCK